jgi:hypothetical protein
MKWGVLHGKDEDFDYKFLMINTAPIVAKADGYPIKFRAERGLHCLTTKKKDIKTKYFI